ncbi:MAG: TetR/AcrR family transcriptional regulator [Deltaproteobacteria bacterium]|nr:TetR/AcrR family transcriptional regulator [Deltaproteobacteria bacterium]
MAVPRGETRASKREGTREKIRAAAWELFSTVGYEETTTHAIAKRAGVAAGTVFLHASDKSDLLFLVMHDRLSDCVEERFATMPKDASVLDRLMHVFAGLFRMYAQTPGVAAAFVKSLPGATGPNAQRMTTMTFGFMHRLSLLLAEGQAKGELAKDFEPIAAAQNVFALYFMALLGWIAGHATLEAALDPQLRDAIALQIRGLRAR